MRFFHDSSLVKCPKSSNSLSFCCKDGTLVILQQIATGTFNSQESAENHPSAGRGGQRNFSSDQTGNWYWLDTESRRRARPWRTSTEPLSGAKAPRVSHQRRLKPPTSPVNRALYCKPGD